MRTERNDDILIGRIGHEYYFVQSVFKHRDDFYGCTGCAVYPLTEGQAEDMLTTDNVSERFDYYWEELHREFVQPDCKGCRFGLNEEGCKHCGYRSLKSWSQDCIDEEGIGLMIDNVDGCVEGLNAIFDDEIEYADCSSCGRIFSSMSVDDFDRVYNMKALVALLAFEAGAVSYDYAIKIIFDAVCPHAPQVA